MAYNTCLWVSRWFEQEHTDKLPCTSSDDLSLINSILKLLNKKDYYFFFLELVVLGGDPNKALSEFEVESKLVFSSSHILNEATFSLGAI